MQEEVVAESDSLVDAAVWESVAVAVSPLASLHPVPLPVHPELVGVPGLWVTPLKERRVVPLEELLEGLLEVAAAQRASASVAVWVEV